MPHTNTGLAMQGWARAAWIRAWFTLTVWVGVPLGALTAMVEVGSQGWGALGLVRLIAATVVTSLVQIPLEVGLVVLAGGLLGFAVARPTSPRSLAGGLVLSALVAAWPAWRVMAVVRPWIREAVFRYTEHASDEVRTALLLLWALADSGEALLLIGGWAVAGSVWASGWWTTAEWTALVQRLDRPRAALGLAVPAVIAAGLALALSTSRASGPDVVVIVLDTVRADRLDLYGHERATAPRLRELATDAVWYRNAVAPSPWTTPSVAALLTGRHGSRFGYLDRPVRLPASTLTVPEALANAGWRTDAVVSNLYASSLAGFDQGFDAWDERDAQGADHISSASVTDKALAALAAAPVGPWFLWAHYYDPHCAYADHPEVQFSDPQYRGPVVPLMNCQTLEDDANTLTSADLQQVTAYYDEEIRHTDHHMGRLLDGLKEAGRYDGALIVVVADHGEAFFRSAGPVYRALDLGVPGAVARATLGEVAGSVACRHGGRHPGHVDGRGGHDHRGRNVALASGARWAEPAQAGAPAVGRRDTVWGVVQGSVSGWVEADCERGNRGA